ncbi:MAG: DUF368 domain-containing protein [Proteobacteria bacterium]|nr:DUF368 domain-containing protein [Pseudomonadota bacterium]
MKSKISLFFKGLAMGTVDIVPGVSGSTVAVLLGIYERFITALRNINLALFKSFFGLFANKFSKASRAHFKETSKAADLPWLLILLAGLATAFIIASLVIPKLMEAFPQVMRGVFFGLVLGSMITPIRDIKKWRGIYLIPLLLCAGFFFVILGHQFSPPTQLVEITSRGDTIESICREAPCFNPPAEVMALPQNSNILMSDAHIIPEGTSVFVPKTYYLYCLAAGFCAICAMLLPGVSGSFILLVLGCYYFMLNTGKSFLHGLAHGTFYGHHLLYIGCFIVGAVAGVAIFSRVFTWLIKHYRNMTLAAIIGILLGCSRAIWPFKEASETGLLINVLPSGDTPQLAATIVAVLCGFGIVALTLFAQKRRKSQDLTE